jgi:hypothetical protein
MEKSEEIIKEILNGQCPPHCRTCPLNHRYCKDHTISQTPEDAASDYFIAKKIKLWKNLKSK